MNLLSWLIVVVVSASPVPAHQNDWLIVPGKRLGPITPNSTRADLDRFFGKANVDDQPVDSGDGPEPATRVYSATAESALSIFWTGTKISDIMPCYPESTTHCKWHTEDGITLGSTLEKLESLNGRPFQLVMWGSDVGGNITSWRAGKLAPLFGEAAKSKLWLTIAYPQPLDGPTAEQSKRPSEWLSDDLGMAEIYCIDTSSLIAAWQELYPIEISRLFGKRSMH